MSIAPDAKFPKEVVDAFTSAKIIGVRSGTQHKYTGVWVAVVNGRVYARSWNDKRTGWFRAFKTEPEGLVQVAALELPARARLRRSSCRREPGSPAARASSAL